MARPAVEDRVILVGAVDRHAARAAVLEARETAPEIPAARTLAQIAGDRTHVPERRRGDGLRGERQRSKSLANGGMRGEIGDSDSSRAEARRSVISQGDVARARQMPHVDEVGWAHDLLFHRHEQIGAAAERHRASRHERGRCAGGRVGTVIREWVHDP